MLKSCPIQMCGYKQFRSISPSPVFSLCFSDEINSSEIVSNNNVGISGDWTAKNLHYLTFCYSYSRIEVAFVFNILICGMYIIYAAV